MTFDIGHNENPKKNIFFEKNVHRIIRFFEKLNKKIFGPYLQKKILRKILPFLFSRLRL